MPPRFAYWTILIDSAATAFRAREQHELMPTLNQLRRTNPNVTMKWFAHGKLWDSPEAAARKPAPAPRQERRGKDWRPGGTHQDPRSRFGKEKPRDQRKPARKPWPRPDDRARHAGGQGRPRDNRPSPWRKQPDKPRAKDTRATPTHDERRDFRPDRGQPRPERTSFTGPGHRPWQGRPKTAGGQRPWKDKPRPAGGRRPWGGARPAPQEGAPRRRRRSDEPSED